MKIWLSETYIAVEATLANKNAHIFAGFPNSIDLFHRQWLPSWLKGKKKRKFTVFLLLGYRCK